MAQPQAAGPPDDYRAALRGTTPVSATAVGGRRRSALLQSGGVVTALRTGIVRVLGRTCCFALGVCSDAPGAAPQNVLPQIVLIGHSAPPSYAPSVARRLEGRANVTGLSCAAGVGELDRRRPSLVHIDCRPEDGAHLRELLSTLRRQTSAVVAAVSKGDDGADLASLGGEVPIHDLRWLRETGAGDDAVSEAVADCVMRHLTVKTFSTARAPRRSGPEAAENYRRAEADRDAAVPPHYRDFKSGVFTPPPDKEAWKRQRQAVVKVVTDSLGELPPRPDPPRARVVSREIHAAFNLERLAIDNGDGNDISALLLIPRGLKEGRRRSCGCIHPRRTRTRSSHRIRTGVSARSARNSCARDTS